MNPNIRRLLDAVLERQIEPEEGFDELAFLAEVRETLARGEPLSGEVRRLVWASPAARTLYQRVRAEAAARARRRWNERGHATQLERRAADSVEEAETFYASGVTVRLTRNAATGKWLVTLQLAPDAMEDLPPGISVRVRDTGGHVWIEGPLDRFRGRDAFWEDDDVSPQERLQRHGLVIEFY